MPYSWKPTDVDQYFSGSEHVKIFIQNLDTDDEIRVNVETRVHSQYGRSYAEEAVQAIMDQFSGRNLQLSAQRESVVGQTYTEDPQPEV